jgi:hypothetical protein
MSKGLYTSLSHKLHVALGEVGKDESRGVEVVGEDGGLEKYMDNHDKWEMT